MKMNTRWMLTAILLLCSLLSVQAQIPAEVTDMMRKCKDNMTHASGIEMDHEKMLIREIVTKEGIAKITMTVTRVKYGVSDNVFMLDTSKYPGAVIVRK